MDRDDIHLVRVTTDEREHQLWAAATAREEAVTRVLDVVPEGWTARLLDTAEALRENAPSNIARGNVRRLAQDIG
jgi:hypothetical protein